MSKLFSRRFFLFRFAAYLLGVGGIFEGAVLLVHRMPWDRVILEDGVVEQGELVFLFPTFFGLLFLAIRYARARGIYVLMSSFASMALFRETDEEIWYKALPGWRKQALALAILLVISFTFRRTLVQEIRAFLRRPSFLLFLLGAIVACAWAQLVARRELLLSHRADRAVEELLELAGYFLILMGVLEEYIMQWRRHRNHLSA